MMRVTVNSYSAACSASLRISAATTSLPFSGSDTVTPVTRASREIGQ